MTGSDDVPQRRQTQKPPPGFVFIEDYVDDDGNVTPGVATRLGISVSTYKKWRLAKKGPQTFRHGKRVMARETVVGLPRRSR
jgi:hypothetical protein